jgi:hypothetical protein
MEALRQRGYYRELFQRFSFSDLGAEAEETSALFSSQGILPEQLDRFLNSPYQETGEIALMRAVLEDALKCFQRSAVSNKRRAQRLAKEAEDWFFARGDGYVFSFVNICAVLGLNPEYIRLGLKRWRPIHMGTCLQP